MTLVHAASAAFWRNQPKPPHPQRADSQPEPARPDVRFRSSQMSCARLLTLVLVFSCAIPLWAGVDDDWKGFYTLALKAVAAKDYARAETMYAKAMHEAEVFGKDDVRVASTSQGLATLLRSEKKLPEAENLARRAVSIYSNNPGEESLEYAEVLWVLAGILMDEGKYQPAIQSVQRVLPLFEQKLAPGSGQVVDATCMQGEAYSKLKMYASAETTLKRCAELRAQEGGVATAEFGETANTLAVVYEHLGKYSDADRYFTFAGKVREQALGIQSLELAETLEEHAVLLHQLGRDAEAKKKEKLAASIRALHGKK
jgi:tetratricopeptide (TPR) repeat protein